MNARSSASAPDHHTPLPAMTSGRAASRKQLDGPFDIARVGFRRRGFSEDRQDGGRFGLLEKAVHRNGQVHGAFAAGIGFREGARQVERDLPGRGRLACPFHHRPGHFDLIDILERLAAGQRGGTAAADGDERAGGQVCGGDAG